MVSQLSLSNNSGVSYQGSRRGSCTQIVFKVLKLALLTLLFKSGVSQATTPAVHEISKSQLPCLPTCTTQASAQAILDKFPDLRNYQLRSPIPAPEDCQRGANTLPGIILYKEGTSGISFSSPIPKESFFNEMGRRAAILEELLGQASTNLSFKDQMDAQSRNPTSRGSAFLIDDLTFHFGISPLHLKNECRAYQKAKEWVKEMDTFSPEQLAEKILKTHGTLMRKIDPSYAGKYRITKLTIHQNRPGQPESPTDSALIYEYWIQSIKLNSATQAEEKKNLRILEQMVTQEGEIRKINPPKTDQQRKLADLVGATFTTPPEQIPGAMLEFAKNILHAYQRRHCPDFNPIEFVAYVHQKLVSIHPFEDWNGHSARLLSKVFLEELGYKLMIRDQKEYMLSVALDLKQPGIFADYLRRAIEWTREYFNAEGEALLGTLYRKTPTSGLR
jgi:prophage maintenance system killer protein